MDKLYQNETGLQIVSHILGAIQSLLPYREDLLSGKLSDPATYRGLQIGSTLCNIMMIIILNRIKSWYNSQLLDQQQGFRQGRGTF